MKNTINEFYQFMHDVNNNFLKPENMKNEDLIHQFNNESELVKKPKLENVLSFIENITNEVLSGNRDALEVFIAFKSIADVLDKSKKIIDDVAIKEVENYQNETYKGFKVSIVQGRKMFDFKNIKEYSEKQCELKAIEDKYKSAFDGVQKGTVQIDGENWIDQNGELLHLPKISYGKNYIKLEKIKS